MTIAFDPPISRPPIVNMRLKAAGSELRVAVVLTLEDDSSFEDVVFVPPVDVPQVARDWLEGYCKDKMQEKYGS